MNPRQRELPIADIDPFFALESHFLEVSHLTEAHLLMQMNTGGIRQADAGNGRVVARLS